MAPPNMFIAALILGSATVAGSAFAGQSNPNGGGASSAQCPSASQAKQQLADLIERHDACLGTKSAGSGEVCSNKRCESLHRQMNQMKARVQESRSACERVSAIVGGSRSYFATIVDGQRAQYEKDAAHRVRSAGRCPAGSSGCTLENAGERIRERVHEGAKNVLRDDNPQGRVREVRDTLKYCLDCGMDAIRDGMDRIDSPRVNRD